MRSMILVDRTPRPDLSPWLGDWPDDAISWRGDVSECGCGCAGCRGEGCWYSNEPYGHLDVVADGWEESLVRDCGCGGTQGPSGPVVCCGSPARPGPGASAEFDAARPLSGNGAPRSAQPHVRLGAWHAGLDALSAQGNVSQKWMIGHPPRLDQPPLLAPVRGTAEPVSATAPAEGLSGVFSPCALRGLSFADRLRLGCLPRPSAKDASIGPPGLGLVVLCPSSWPMLPDFVESLADAEGMRLLRFGVIEDVPGVGCVLWVYATPELETDLNSPAPMEVHFAMLVNEPTPAPGGPQDFGGYRVLHRIWGFRTFSWTRGQDRPQVPVPPVNGPLVGSVGGVTGGGTSSLPSSFPEPFDQEVNNNLYARYELGVLSFGPRGGFGLLTYGWDHSTDPTDWPYLGPGAWGDIRAEGYANWYLVPMSEAHQWFRAPDQRVQPDCEALWRPVETMLVELFLLIGDAAHNDSDALDLRFDAPSLPLDLALLYFLTAAWGLNKDFIMSLCVLEDQ